MDTDDIKFWVLVIFLGWLFAFSAIAVVSGGSALLRSGQTEIVTGTVAVFEQKSIFGQHTDVTFVTVGGSEVKYAFIGYEEFMLNQTYTIKCIDRPIAIWVGPFLFFDTWGEIIA
jgi:hypothetical protein